VKRVLDTQYPDAEKAVLVMDNLNTHTISSGRSVPPVKTPGDSLRAQTWQLA
jgi:hypothetical protein